MKKSLFYILLLISSLTIAQSESDYSIAEDYFKKSEYKKAIQYYQKLVEREPFNSFYLKRLITCYQENNQFDAASTTIQNTLNKAPTQTYWFVELGYNLDRQQKESEAKKMYNKALQAIESNPLIGGQTARFFKNNNLLEQAVTAYKITAKLNKNANYNFQLARIYGELGKFDDMFSYYADVIDKDENYASNVQSYISSYLTEDPLNQYNLSFKKALLRKSVRNPKSVWNELLSWLFTKQGEYNKAFVQEKAIFKRVSEDLSSFFVLGRISFDAKAYGVAKEVFLFILKNSVLLEDKVYAELYLIKIEEANKSNDVQDLFLKKLAQYGYNTNTIAIQKAYADYLTFQRNQPKKAQEVLEKAITLCRSKFEKAKIKLKLGDVLVFTNQFNRALIYFSQVQTQLKNHPLAQEARFKVAETSFFKGDFSWAKTQLKVLKGSTSQLIANDAANLFLIVSDNEPQDSIATGLKDFAKAKLLAYQNKKQEAIDILTNVLETFKGQNIEDETLLEIAKLYTETSQFNAAITQLEKLISTDKNGVFVDDAYYQLAEIYRNRLKNKEKASEYYQKIIFEQASSIYLVEARKKFRQLRGDTLN